MNGVPEILRLGRVFFKFLDKSKTKTQTMTVLSVGVLCVSCVSLGCSHALGFLKFFLNFVVCQHA